ncbi:MAG: cell division protein FtsA [Deltaproteobacteria bacterium]|jgi:cell division protein FtsA|nr:cell division protein FtsA [Deltaproteobacteria bacterium]
MAQKNDLLVALDVGTTKICCLVATVNEGGGIDIKGLGVAPSSGLSRGRVININDTVKAIRKAVDDAADMSGFDIDSAYVGIAGEHINGRKVQGSVAIRNGTVGRDDMERAIKGAMVMQVPSDCEILTRVPLEFHIDDRVGIVDPIGMGGTRLEVFVHAFTVSSNALRDLARCVMDAGLNVDDIFLESVASAESVLTPAEKQQGVVLIDIGGGTSDLAVFANGAIHHIFEVGMGGDALSHDLATGLNISLETAEILKLSHGCCHEGLVDEDYEIEVPSLDGLNSVNIGVSSVCQILRKRVEELFGYLSNNLTQSGFDDVVRNVVLTGGTALLKGLPEMGLEYFNRQIRVGYPSYVGGLAETVANPMYSTVVGLLLYGPQERGDPSLPLTGSTEHGAGSLGRLFGRIKQMFG